MLNRWAGIGNATANPEMKYTPANVGYVQFNVACNRPFENAKGEKETDFIFVVAWKELAEVIVKFLRVGRKIYVEGRLQVRNYEDDDGVKRYITEIVAEKIDFLDSPPDDVKNQHSQQGQNNNRGYQNQGNQGNNRNYQKQGSNNQGNRSQSNYQAKNNQSYKNQGNNGGGYKNQGNSQSNRSQSGNNRNYQNQGSNQGYQSNDSNGGKMPWE